MALTGTSNEQKIWNFLKGKGLTDCGAAGLMGNLYAESGLQANNLENAYEKQLGYTDTSYTEAVDNGKYTNFGNDSAGYGIAQWTYYTRKQKLLNYAKATGKSIGDLEMQLEFLIKELTEDYTAVLNTLKTATTIPTASYDVLTKFERPANQSVSVQVLRATYGQKYYNSYAGSTTTTVQTVAEYAYNSNKQLSEHFNIKEFRCKCGATHSTKLSGELIKMLEKLFDKLNCSMIVVNSGYRCSYWDKQVGGYGSGPHTNGIAADIVCYDSKKQKISSKIVSCAGQDLGFGGIANIDKTYTATHVDVREGAKWYGDETVNNNTVTSNFYTYYGISKTEISKYTNGSTTTTSATTKSNTSTEAAKSYDGSLSGSYKVTATSLNIRKGAGTNKTVIVTIPDGTAVQNYGYYTTVSGVKWLLVQFTYSGTTYTGFASSTYLKKT